MDEPAWGTLIFDRRQGSWREPGRSTPSPRDLAFLREHVRGFTNDEPEKIRQLRTATIDRLTDDSFWALMFLSIVGTREDLPLVEPFLDSSRPSVSAAAKICRYELQHKPQ